MCMKVLIGCPYLLAETGCSGDLLLSCPCHFWGNCGHCLPAKFFHAYQCIGWQGAEDSFFSFQSHYLALFFNVNFLASCVSAFTVERKAVNNFSFPAFICFSSFWYCAQALNLIKVMCTASGLTCANVLGTKFSVCLCQQLECFIHLIHEKKNWWGIK